MTKQQKLRKQLFLGSVKNCLQLLLEELMVLLLLHMSKQMKLTMKQYYVDQNKNFSFKHVYCNITHYIHTAGINKTLLEFY